jgi:acetyltransferase-like isoleucine patch superfamily enzyme
VSNESVENPSQKVDELPEEVMKEEINLQFSLYMVVFFVIYYISWVLVGAIFLFYALNFFYRYVLQVDSFASLFIEPSSLIALLGMPLVIIFSYFLRMLCVGVTTRIFWRFSEKISPSKSGVIPRNIKSKAADYYHLRGFMIKYGKNLFTKGMFPWLSRWFFNFVGSNVIGKGSVLEESVGSDKFATVGENCYLGPNHTLASHLVQAIFGNIQYFRMLVGDNVTLGAGNQIGPGSEIWDNSYLLPFSSTNKHSVLGSKDKKSHRYYFGVPLRKIFKKKTMSYLGISEQDLERNENLEDFIDEAKKKKFRRKEKLDSQQPIADEEEEEEDIELNESEELSEESFVVDFTTSSAISRVNVKFLIVYIPILWLAGLMISIFWYEYTKEENWLGATLYLPVAILTMIYLFILGVLIFSKLLLILVNLIHKPKEGIFLAEVGQPDYDFWMLRTELKKLALWFLRNSPLPWADAVALRLFGVKMDFSSHLNDAWCDVEFISMGRNCLIGQGATVMSSMVIGKYLIIKRVILSDYVMIGGHTTIAPGTVMGHDSVVGAVSHTMYRQLIEPNTIYGAIPARFLKENKYAEERRDIVVKRVVDESRKLEETHEVNIDEDKKKFIKAGDDD